MAFLKFLRKQYKGEKPSNSTTTITDGQLIFDTNTNYMDQPWSYMYLDAEGKRLSITDRKDPIKLENKNDINGATRNGWYKIDLGTTKVDGKDVRNTLSLRTQSDDKYKKGQIVTINQYAKLFVYGQNENYGCTQILSTEDERGYYLIRRKLSSRWTLWQSLETINRIDRRYLDTITKPGFYYFTNKDDPFSDGELTDRVKKLKITKYTFESSASGYYMVVSGYGRSGYMAMQTLYPFGENAAKNGYYYVRRSYSTDKKETVNGKEVTNKEINWTNWEVHRTCGYVELPASDLNLDDVKEPDTYQISGTIKIKAYGQTESAAEASYKNPILEVKAHYKHSADAMPKHATQILYTNGQDSSLTYTRKGFSKKEKNVWVWVWKDWTCSICPNGFTIKSTDDDNCIKKLPSGSYFLETGYVFTTENTNSNLGIPANVQVTSCRLVVDNCSSKFGIQTLYCFLSNAKKENSGNRDTWLKKMPGVTKDSFCVFRRYSSNGVYKKWNLIEPTIIEKPKVMSKSASSWTALPKQFTTNDENGIYRVEVPKTTGGKYHDINGYAFGYGILTFTKLGSNARAVLYPINGSASYVLHVDIDLQKTPGSSTCTAWRWEVPPKVANIKYPLNEFYNGKQVYYYKLKKTIAKDRVTVLSKPSSKAGMNSDTSIIWTHYYTSRSRTIGNNLPALAADKISIGTKKYSFLTSCFGDQRTIIIFPMGTNDISNTVLNYGYLTGAKLSNDDWTSNISADTRITPGTFMYRRSEQLVNFFTSKKEEESLYIEYKYYQTK